MPLNAAKVHATIPAQDIERAKAFYSEKLGLKPVMEMPEAAVYEFHDGSRFNLYPSTGRASGDHTQLAVTLVNIEAEVAQLQANGVVFEEYEGEFGTVNGIATTVGVKSAFFKDSEGNLIGLIEFL